jgi:hypothetical protein
MRTYFLLVPLFAGLTLSCAHAQTAQETLQYIFVGSTVNGLYVSETLSDGSESGLTHLKVSLSTDICDVRITADVGVAFTSRAGEFEESLIHQPANLKTPFTSIPIISQTSASSMHYNIL